jgi:hypothetical protein
MIGSEIEAWTSATIPADPIEVIIHEAPTDWIRPPKLDARLASQTARKIGLSSEARSDGLAGLEPGSAVAAGERDERARHFIGAGWSSLILKLELPG